MNTAAALNCCAADLVWRELLIHCCCGCCKEIGEGLLSCAAWSHVAAAWQWKLGEEVVVVVADRG